VCGHSFILGAIIYDHCAALVISSGRVWTLRTTFHWLSDIIFSVSATSDQGVQIVPSALRHALRAIEGYTNLTELTLTHLSMTYENDNGIPILPSLKKLQIGQAIFMQPSTIAKFILSPSEHRFQSKLTLFLIMHLEMKNLHCVNLVDAYTNSIWGPRVRRADVEYAALQFTDGQPLIDTGQPVWTDNLVEDRIKAILTCTAKTERIIGGDRVEDLTVPL